MISELRHWLNEQEKYIYAAECQQAYQAMNAWILCQASLGVVQHTSRKVNRKDI